MFAVIFRLHLARSFQLYPFLVWWRKKPGMFDAHTKSEQLLCSHDIIDFDPNVHNLCWVLLQTEERSFCFGNPRMAT
jgi:hypothetical protein